MKKVEEIIKFLEDETVKRPSKRVIEVKRGDDVPINAKWLESLIKESGVEKRPSGEGGICYVSIYSTFDVFEVEE